MAKALAHADHGTRCSARSTGSICFHIGSTPAIWAEVRARPNAGLIGADVRRADRGETARLCTLTGRFGASKL
jgi:hypothetical protein